MIKMLDNKFDNYQRQIIFLQEAAAKINHGAQDGIAQAGGADAMISAHNIHEAFTAEHMV